MSAIARIVSLYRSFLGLCTEVSSVLIFILVFLVTGDVFGRYVLKSPIPGTYEIAESMMVFIVFLAYALTEASGKNIRIGLIERKISERQKVYLDLIPYVLGMFIFGIICWKSFDQALSAWEVNQRMSGLLRIPTWPAKSVIVLGSFLLVVQFFIQFVSSIYLIIKER